VLRDLALTDFERSLLVTIPVVCFSLAAFAGPPLSARAGEERALLVMCGLLCLGLALRPWWGSAALFGGTVVCGIAVAVMNVMMPSVLRRRFPAHLGEMTAAYTMALSIGAAMASGLTVPLATTLNGGIPAALAAWAVVPAVAFAVWIPQLRVPRPDGRAAGSGIGLLREAHAWQMALFFGVQSALFYALLSWLPTIYRDHGVDAAAAGGVLAWMTLTGIAGNFASPQIVTRLGRPRLSVAMCAGATTLGVLGVVLAPTAAPLAWATLLGIGTGGTFSVSLLLIAARARDARIAARLSSMTQGFGYMLSIAGPFGVGLLHSASRGWTAPLLAVLALCVMTLGSGVVAARPGVISR
jgi:CP family cyanate transporter-like MFS transporter